MKFFFFILFFTAALNGWEEVLDKATLPLLAPDWAQRKVGKIRLDNGLEAYLVSDPHTEESGAALSVKAGSWDEPKDSPGLAHFLEHMLFLGTAKYPKESEFESYLASFQGHTNAFTYNDMTGFMFSVRNEGFLSALDRFASFFKDPLFNPSGVGREVKAIDQEWRINSQKDNFVRLQVLKELALPDHPFSRFNSGNAETLKDASQSELKAWYAHHYSADKMRLWVMSALPLDELKAVVEKDFGGIPSSKGENSSPHEEELFGKNILGKLVAMEPIQDEMTLALIWELPAEFSTWDQTRPWVPICWILGEEGHSSVLAELKRENLARSLSCGELRLSQSKLLFAIETELTDKGLKEKEAVIKLIFQGLNRISEKGISESLFNEIQALERLDYQWASRQSVFTDAMENAFQQSYEPLESYPERSEMVERYSPEKIQTVIDFVKPENAIYFLVAPARKTGLTYPLKEKWTQVKYLVAPYDTSRFKSAGVAPGIDMPKPNRFLPGPFERSLPNTVWSRLPVPEKMIEGDKGILYYLKDTLYGVPQIYWSFELKTPVVSYASAQSAVLAEVYRKSLEDALSQSLYEAKLAGLELKILEGEEGFIFTISGYNQKAETLLLDLLDELNLPHLQEERFNTILSQLKRDYKNFQLDSPLEQANELFEETIYEPYKTNAQKAKAAQSITYEKFQAFLKRLYTKNYLEGLTVGNLTQESAEKLWRLWQTRLPPAAYPVSQHKNKKVAEWLNQGPYLISHKTKAKGSAFLLALEEAEFTFKKRGAQQVLQQTLKKDFFAELRTHQQTGYLVGTSADEYNKVLFDLFYVQSATHSAEELLWRTEAFIEGFLQDFSTQMPQERFAVSKASLMALLKEKPKSLVEMGETLQRLAFTYQGDFDWIEKRIAALNDLTYEEFSAISHEILSRENRARVAILVQGSGKNPYRYLPVNSSKILKKHAKFH